MGTRKAIQAAAAGLFALIILSPFLQERLHLFEYGRLTENRLKKQRPTDWQTLFRTESHFATRYEEYFNDNYGLRDLLIRIKTQIDYSLFRKSEKIIIGRDNWLFYKSVVEDEQIGLEKAPHQAFQLMLERMLELNRLLTARGMTLVVLPCPMKNTIYPEMLPPGAPRRPDPSAFQRYRHFLADHPEIVTVDATPLLMKLKQSFQVFHKTDFHWTDPAGAYVAKELVDRLGTMSGNGPLWDQPIEIRMERLLTGGQNQSVGLLWPIQEDALFLRGDLIKAAVGEYTHTREANEWTYRSKPGQGGKLIPETVMFGDSFADAFLRAGFANHFSHLQKFFNWEFRKKYRDIPEGTRFVVLEHVEALLNGLLNDVMWPEEILAR